MVERELSARPNFSQRVLQTLASELDGSIGTMDPRLFHAEYVVPAQRRIAAGAGRKRKRRGKRTTRTGRSGSRTHREAASGAGAEAAFVATEPDTTAEPIPSEPLEPESAATEPVAAVAELAAREEAESASRRQKRRETRVDAQPRRPIPATSGTGRRIPRSFSRVQAARAAFFAWARVLADADSPAELVQAFDEVDRYVDDVLKA